MNKEVILGFVIGIIIGGLINMIMNRGNRSYSKYIKSIDSLNTELNKLREKDNKLKDHSDSLTIVITRYDEWIDSLSKSHRIRSDSVMKMSTDESIEFLSEYFNND